MPASGRLRNLRDRLLVERHVAANALARRTLGDAHLLDNERGVNEYAPVVLVLAHGGKLLRRAEQLEVAAEATVRREQDHVECLDAAVLLHAPVEADGLIEDFQAPLLTTWDGFAPRDEEHAVGHADSFRLRPGGQGRACPADSLRPSVR